MANRPKYRKRFHFNAISARISREVISFSRENQARIEFLVLIKYYDHLSLIDGGSINIVLRL